MTFWEALEAKQAAQAKARRDEWLDVAPELCELCQETKRGVILGSCVQCFETYEAMRALPLVAEGSTV